MTPQLTIITAVIVVAIIALGAYRQTRTHAVRSLDELASNLTAVNLQDLNGNLFVCVGTVSAIIRNATWHYGFIRTFANADPDCLEIADAIRRETSALCAYRRLLCFYTVRALFRGGSLPYTDSLASHYLELKQLTLDLAQEMGRGDLVLRLERAM